MVVLGRPSSVFYKLIDERMRAIEAERFFHIGIYSDRCEILGIPLDIGFDQRVLEAEYGKLRLVIVLSFLGGINDLLQGSLPFFCGALNVLLRKFAVLVEGFPKAKFECLPCFCIDRKFDVARNILPKVKHLFAAWRGYHGGLECLMLGYGHVIGRDKRCLVLCGTRLFAITWRKPCIYDLAILIICHADSAVIRPAPRAVADDRLPCAVLLFNLKLKNKFRLFSILVFESPSTA